MHEREPNAVRAQLDKILASEGFVNAERLRRFLRFTVEASLNGDEGQIKEYLIGREVFDRDDRYDPRLDPIVRVEARRLRTRLEEYYDGPGRQDPLRIELPKGSYVPAVRPAADEAASSSRGISRRRWLWPLAAGIVLVMAAVAAFYSFPGSAESELVAVVPARWLWREAEGFDKLEESLAETLAAELANSRAARVIAWPAMTRYRPARKEARELAAELGADKILMVSLRGESGAIRVTVWLMDPISSEKLRVSEYLRNDLTSLEAQRELARVIAREFTMAQAGGVQPSEGVAGDLQ